MLENERFMKYILGIKGIWEVRGINKTQIKNK